MTTGIIFVGGPGRSGTSFVADRVGRHAGVATFQDVELKIFGEFGGLLDMQAVLVEHFSPNRGDARHQRLRDNPALHRVRPVPLARWSRQNLYPANGLQMVLPMHSQSRLP
jgi:hypothetical protein